MFSYSRAVADQRLGHPPMAYSVLKTSEKLVGPYLPRPFTSPSCGAPRHPAPALTGVGCERVSGTRMDTLVDDLGNIEKIMNSKTKQKIVYGAGEGYPSAGAATGCKAGLAASSSSNRGRPAVGRQAPGRALASGEEDTGTPRGGTRRRRGGGSDDETPLCSPSPAVMRALGKRPYRRIAGTAEGTASAANGCDGDTGRRTRRRDTSAGDLESAWLPGPGKRKKRGARSRPINGETVPARCTDGPRGSLVSARRASVLGADTPDPAVGGGRTKPLWLDCMRPTTKRGGPCSESSRRRRGGRGSSFWPASTPTPGGALVRWYWINFVHGRLSQRRAWILGS